MIKYNNMVQPIEENVSEEDERLQRSARLTTFKTQQAEELDMFLDSAKAMQQPFTECAPLQYDQFAFNNIYRNAADKKMDYCEEQRNLFSFEELRQMDLQHDKVFAQATTTDKDIDLPVFMALDQGTALPTVVNEATLEVRTSTEQNHYEELLREDLFAPSIQSCTRQPTEADEGNELKILYVIDPTTQLMMKFTPPQLREYLDRQFSAT